jgi:hypothetical protein
VNPVRELPNHWISAFAHRRLRSASSIVSDLEQTMAFSLYAATIPSFRTLGDSLPSERDPGLRRFERCAPAQSDWLQRLAAFHVVGQCAANLSHKSALILGIAQAS